MLKLPNEILCQREGLATSADSRSCAASLPTSTSLLPLSAPGATSLVCSARSRIPLKERGNARGRWISRKRYHISNNNSLVTRTAFPQTSAYTQSTPTVSSLPHFPMAHRPSLLHTLCLGQQHGLTITRCSHGQTQTSIPMWLFPSHEP